MTNKKKACFGVLEKVFPMGEEGLREVVPACLQCPEKKACLQEALKTREGLEFRSDLLDRLPVRGLAGRLRRWSEKKTLSRRIKQDKGKEK